LVEIQTPRRTGDRPIIGGIRQSALQTEQIQNTILPVSKPPQIAPPAATGNAGPQFEAGVGAFYLLSLLAGSEPRGLPGATIRTVEFQRRGSGHPLDDVIIKAVNADGSAAVLEIGVAAARN
jgi:hypothetical protein